MNQLQLESSADLLRAVTHPLRFKLLSFIHKNGNVNVNKIYNTLRIEQSITSQHLKILRESGLVITERKGKFIYYSLNYKILRNVIKSIDKFFRK